MFLFNKYRNAQQNFESGNKVYSVKWKTFLNTNPLFGAESTAVFDAENNLYFGSHSGNFYSLDKTGKIRWVFTTKTKIYSSPLIIEDSVIFSGGDGYLYSLDLNGNLNWAYDITERKKKNKLSKLITLLTHLPFTYSLNRKRNITYLSWSSPNTTNKKIFITGFGTGLFCFDLNGTVLWKYDLGFPRYQLSGITIDDLNRIYCSSRRGYSYSLSESGQLIWKKKIKLFAEPWGNPVVCQKKEQVFFFFSKHERYGFIHALNFNGETNWMIKLGAIRGSCAVSKCSNFIYCCDLNGYIYKINANTGKIDNKKRLVYVNRGLWTTPTLDANGDILLSTKDSNTKGRIIKLNKDLDVIWEFHTGKALSVPVISQNSDIFFGSWDGYYYAIKTKE